MLSHGTKIVMYQGVQAVLRSGKYFQVPGHYRRRPTESTKRFFEFFTVPPLNKVRLGIQANGLQTSRLIVITEIKRAGHFSSPALKGRKMEARCRQCLDLTSNSAPASHIG
jgi:hypothetical protein